MQRFPSGPGGRPAPCLVSIFNYINHNINELTRVDPLGPPGGAKAEKGWARPGRASRFSLERSALRPG